jgi:hypothetical protein
MIYGNDFKYNISNIPEDTGGEAPGPDRRSEY